jgi:hypothetical protein
VLEFCAPASEEKTDEAGLYRFLWRGCDEDETIMHYDACDGGAGAQQIPNEAETKRPAAVQVLQINNNSNRTSEGKDCYGQRFKKRCREQNKEKPQSEGRLSGTRGTDGGRCCC